MNNLSRLRALVLVVILTLISFLLIRFIFEFSRTDSELILPALLLFPTNFISVFFSSIKIGDLEISSVFAIIFLIIIGYLASKIITSLERQDEDSTLLEIIEAVLRAVEFFIILRVILEFIGADPLLSSFTALIYFLTNWTGFIFTPINITFGMLDISSLIVLVIFIFLDINTEVILRGVKFIKAGSAKSVDFIGNNLPKRKLNESNVDYEEDSNSDMLPKVLKPTTFQPVEENSSEKLSNNPDSNSQSSQVINIQSDQVIVQPPSLNGKQESFENDKDSKKDNSVKPHTVHKDDITAPEG